MMRQYMEVRRGLPANTLLLFRLGDFYEMFEEDAELGSRLLGITLTQRNGIPMAGIPYHAADTYINKLLEQNQKVAICDQMEPPQPGKIVRRALSRIFSPGTTLEDHHLDSRHHHFILALNWHDGALHGAWMDLTTAEFQIGSENQVADLTPVLSSLAPREIVVPEVGYLNWSNADQMGNQYALLAQLFENRPVTEVPDYHFDPISGGQTVLDALKVLSLEGFGVEKDHPALGAAGALVTYATENLCARPQNLTSLRLYRSQENLLLDPTTLSNLEVFRSASGARDGSLLDALDATVTAAGARLLEGYLAGPDTNRNEIERRQNIVGEFLESPGFAAELHDYLKCVRDLQRIVGRLQNRIRNPRELGAIRDTLRQIPFVSEILSAFNCAAVQALQARLLEFPHLRKRLDEALDEDLPSLLHEGGYIRDDYDSELDRLRSLTRENKTWIANLERKEQTRTGIRNLRIRYNTAFGYFIQITKSNLHLVPENYIRRQTMVNAERFYTEELKAREGEILNAEEKSLTREEELFRDLVAAILKDAPELVTTARALAEIDLFVGWSKLAREWDYCRPEVTGESTLEIEQGRHPVVEQMMRKERFGLAGTHAFVPNDAYLDGSTEQIALITGPNMAGKSTYIRQVALIVLMAHIGCWAPAKSCRIGTVDRIFSRVGAADELARGNSTFMVEMNETANIINNATPSSLIILDEIGRGTSTYDGLSIAWAVVEHLHGNGGSGPRTLFATHYHELTQLERQLPRVRNYRVSVKEWNDEIIFVRQVVKGSADKSYGIQVARLAGLPPSVISRAKDILAKLEADDSSHNLLRKRLNRIKHAEESGESLSQLEMF